MSKHPPQNCSAAIRESERERERERESRLERNSRASTVASRPRQLSDWILDLEGGGRRRGGRGRHRSKEVELLRAQPPIIEFMDLAGPELKEMIGSGIFAVNNDDVQLESENSFLTSSYGTYSHNYQFCFNGKGTILPEKPMLLAGVAKQRELSGTLLSESEPRLKKRLSDAKSRELSGHGIFARPREVPLRPLAAQYLELNDKGLGRTTPRKSPPTVNIAQRTAGPNNFLFGDEIPARTSKKMHAKKIADLIGNGIFKDVAPPGFSEKTRSKAKLKELIGNDIFADRKDPPRYYFGGIRKPPGGESSITLA
ncbi:unnamed protein product [Musa acuminata subsp. malaccensis]|uniref:(wild Malaysian banana) hypothetical protein n=3 Tax=Musa acuminata TaxID=4641 RepID=A0A804L6R4_MUSAM|nr:PREDICTED: uncharacterized protein LOC103971330 isoform X1 [Musa acuminata subsp. malaccensis]CAG1864295.1 unnamed protein product [Musa acuminata subsp. malaccensis]